MHKPSRYAVAATSIIAIYSVVLIGVAVIFGAGLLEEIEILSGFLLLGAGCLSAALWIRSARPGGEHANLMAAISTAAAVIYSAVGTFASADMANQSLVYWGQVGAFFVASALMLYIFFKTLRRPS